MFESYEWHENTREYKNTYEYEKIDKLPKAQEKPTLQFKTSHGGLTGLCGRECQASLLKDAHSASRHETSRDMWRSQKASCFSPFS